MQKCFISFLCTINERKLYETTRKKEKEEEKTNSIGCECDADKKKQKIYIIVLTMHAYVSICDQINEISG